MATAPDEHAALALGIVVFITERPIIVGVACLSYLWFQPPLEEARTLALGWIGEMHSQSDPDDDRCGGSTFISTPHQAGQRLNMIHAL